MSARAFVTDDGVTLHYGDYGPADGVPVVLCHGMAASGRQFVADANYFAGLGYRVLVPDLRGHGQSGKTEPVRVADFAISRLGRDLIGMLDDAGVGAVDWVGNSLGGIVALWILEAAPERLRSLATFGTSYRLHLPRFAPQLLPIGYALLGRPLIAALTAFGTSRDGAARRLIRQVLAQFDPAVGHAVAATLVRYDLIANAVETQTPILMLRGGHDRQVNSALGPTLQAMTGLPHFTLVEVPEGGHCANLDATDQVRAELKRFWARRP